MVDHNIGMHGKKTSLPFVVKDNTSCHTWRMTQDSIMNDSTLSSKGNKNTKTLVMPMNA
jgi:hypothetical protein